jgi:translation initiation factor 2B subunit (eIF-2B alpha/beta/delta family)
MTPSHKYSHLCEKPFEFFKRLTDDETRQAKQWTKIATISDKAQEVSHAVAEIMVTKIKSHIISDSVILPTCCKIVNTVLCLAKNMRKNLKIPVR